MAKDDVENIRNQLEENGRDFDDLFPDSLEATIHVVAENCTGGGNGDSQSQGDGSEKLTDERNGGDDAGDGGSDGRADADTRHEKGMIFDKFDNFDQDNFADGEHFLTDCLGVAHHFVESEGDFRGQSAVTEPNVKFRVARRICFDLPEGHFEVGLGGRNG